MYIPSLIVHSDSTLKCLYKLLPWNFIPKYLHDVRRNFSLYIIILSYTEKRSSRFIFPNLLSASVSPNIFLERVFLAFLKNHNEVWAQTKWSWRYLHRVLYNIAEFLHASFFIEGVVLKKLNEKNWNKLDYLELKKLHKSGMSLSIPFINCFVETPLFQLGIKIL